MRRLMLCLTALGLVAFAAGPGERASASGLSGSSLALSSPAVAPTAPLVVSGSSLTLSSPAVAPTAPLVVSGSGFAPGVSIEVFFDRTDLASTVTDGQGHFGPVGINIPAAARSGVHWISALDSASMTGAQKAVAVQTSWPMGSANANHTGYNVYENALDPTAAAALSPLASAQMTGSVAAPIVLGGVAYAASSGVLDAFLGCGSGACQLLWRAPIGGSITTAPAAASGVVYVGSSTGTLAAFSTTCGKKGSTCTPVWTGTVGGAVTSPVSVFGGLVYVGASDGSLSAFAAGGCGAASCSPVWSATTSGAISSAATIGGNAVYVGSQDGSVYAFSRTSGAFLWKAATGGPIVSTPAVSGKFVYVGSEDGSLYVFPSSCSSAATGSCAASWQAPVGAPIAASPAVAYNEVYVGADDGSIHAWSTLSCGTPPCAPGWVVQAPGAVTGALAVADGVLYATSADGSISAYAARGLGVVTSLQVGSLQLSSPAVINGGVYVGAGDGALHVFGLKATGGGPAPALTTLSPLSTPIRHVVVLFQENHTFDNVLGDLCVVDSRCDGATTGQLPDGQTIPLSQSPDIPPVVDHSVAGQTAAIDGGKMDGFPHVKGCSASDSYQCYSQYTPDQIPNLSALARTFVISDRTFEESDSPSFGGHLDLAAAQLDGFTGDAPGFATPSNPGWGCDSNLRANWIDPTGSRIRVPSCIPRPDGSGPFAQSPVASVPSIMDRLDASGFTWRIYTGQFGVSQSGYAWAVCPMFANCLYSVDAKGMSSAAQVINDANAGVLPSMSLVMPDPPNSQHNTRSMIQGDNWIGSVVSAIENGPDWSSTAIFLTYDDCGCFYDHVPPPPGLGIRVPMVIISAYAKPGYTDSNVASFASLLAYTEHTFSISSLGADDSSAYDYSDSFDYTKTAMAPIHLTHRPVPKASIRYMKTHPPNPHDPT